ncbi:hypothetical protein UT300012_23720 [Paraclostridium bifermentans]
MNQMNQMDKINEIMSSIMECGTDTISTFRDESAQEKVRMKRIPKLKKEPKKKSKILIVTELAIPFNPATGKEDDVYNRVSKCRPVMATETAMVLYKKMASENPDVKKAFMQRSGLKDWDLSNVTELTAEDKQVFNKFRYPVVYTLNTCKVNIPNVTRSKFGKDYKVDVNRDKNTGMIIGEMPVILQINKFLGDLVRVEVEWLEADIKAGRRDLTDEDKKKEISKLYNSVVVESDRPSNFVLALEIPLAADSTVKEDVNFKELENADVFDFLCLVPMNSKFKEAIGKYQDGSYKLIDKYNNFWEIDMLCSSDEEPKDLGRNTTFEKPMQFLKDLPEFDGFNEAFTKFMDNDKENQLEKKFLASSYIIPMTDQVQSNVLDAISNIVPPDDKRLLEGVIKANASIIPLIYGEEVGDEILANAEVGLAPEGNIDEKASMEANRQHALSKGDAEDTGDFDIEEFVNENSGEVDLGGDEPLV